MKLRRFTSSNCLVFFLLLEIICSGKVLASDVAPLSSDQPDQKQAEKILEGSVEHSLSLSPLGKRWKVGARFDPSKLPEPQEESLLWWKVPAWLEGSWKNSGKIKRIYFKDFDNPEKQEDFTQVEVEYPDIEVIGYQKDKSGSVWACIPVPYVGRSVQKEQINISIIDAAETVLVNEKQVLIKFIACTLSVQKKNGKIVSIVQRESLQSYKPIDENRILVQASMQFYDADGKRRYESKVLGQARREAAYKETPYLPTPGKVPTLIDLRLSFVKFLRKHNLEELRPDLAPLPPLPGYRLIVL